MATFTDSQGRQWTVRITAASLRRVREALNIRLAELADDNGKKLFELIDNVEQLIDVLFVVCEAQTKELALTDVQFGELFGGIELDQAATAFIEAYALFFANRVGAKLLPRMAQRAKSLAATMETRATETLNALTDEALLTELTNRSGNSPASPGSTRNRSLSGN